MDTALASPGPLQSFLARRFYFLMAILIALVVCYGFSRTIDAGLIHPAFVVPWILYVHAVVFAGWIVLLLVQTGLLQAGQWRLHRTLGQASVWFAVALVIVGIRVAIVMARLEAARGDAAAAPFLIVPFSDMLTFSLAFGLAVRYRGDTQAHRRLMLMAALSLTGAAFARFPQALLPGPHGYSVLLDLMVGLGVLRDWLVERRVHRVYLIGLPLLLLAQALTDSIHHADWWARVSQGLL